MITMLKASWILSNQKWLPGTLTVYRNTTPSLWVLRWSGSSQAHPERSLGCVWDMLDVYRAYQLASTDVKVIAIWTDLSPLAH